MSIYALADHDEPKDKLEVLARAWIVCDPNRGDAVGSGFHPDDIIGQGGGIFSVGETGSSVVKEPHDTPLTGKPRWHWFIPRAKALEEFLFVNGYEIKPL